MLMVSATGDWTKNTPEEEFPAIKKIYSLYNAEGNIEQEQFDSPHNYHQNSREAVYRFFGKKILSDLNTSNFKEKDFHVDQLSSLLAYWGRKAPENPRSLKVFISDRIAELEGVVQSLRHTDSVSLKQAQLLFQD